MSATGRSPRGGGPCDVFPTPAWATQALIRNACLPGGTFLPGGRWFEPAVGAGDIVRAVESVRPGLQSWIACEIRDVPTPPYIDGHALYRGNFLEMKEAPLPVSVIITNPPFVLAEEFARKCIALAEPCRATVALLLRLAFLETRKRVAFHRAHPADVYVLAQRPSFSCDGATDSAAYAWFVWGPGRGNRWYLLDEGPRR